MKLSTKISSSLLQKPIHSLFIGRALYSKHFFIDSIIGFGVVSFGASMILRLESYWTFLYIFAEKIINRDKQGYFWKASRNDKRELASSFSLGNEQCARTRVGNTRGEKRDNLILEFMFHQKQSTVLSVKSQFVGKLTPLLSFNSVPLEISTDISL